VPEFSGAPAGYVGDHYGQGVSTAKSSPAESWKGRVFGARCIRC
jgi:hypothetical protein